MARGQASGAQEEKPYTDENEIVCWPYEHSKDRLGKGINFITALYPSQGMALPVGFTLIAKTERYVDKNDDGSTGVLYLVRSRTTLPFDNISTSYQKRWNVERYHQSLKQNAALAKSPTPTVTTQTNHFFAALGAFASSNC